MRARCERFACGCRARGEKGKADAFEAQARVSAKVVENIRALPPVLLMDED
jgi:hypothetical protein